MRYFITLLIVSMCFLGSAQDGLENAFAKANKAYTAEKYEIAIAGYNQVLKAKLHSAELYFNLANAHYKLNHIAPAIYNYEKALQLDPSDTDIITNLGYANQMKIDAIEELPKDGFKEWFKSFVTSQGTDTWAYLSIVAGLFTMLFLIFYVYAQVASKKRLFFILSIAGIVCTMVLIYTAFASINIATSDRQAIIFDKEVVTRTEPRVNADEAFKIHEGTKITILEVVDGWAQAQLANGSKAWVPTAVYKEL